MDTLRLLGGRSKKHTVDPSHLRQAYLENLEKYRENFTKVATETASICPHDHGSALCRCPCLLSGFAPNAAREPCSNEFLNLSWLWDPQRF